MSSHEHGASYLENGSGFKSWFFSVDHKRIGLMYLVMVTIFFLIAGLLALGIRTELLTPEGDLFDGDTYNKVFTLHGALMVFVFIIPSIPATMGNFFLPIMVGAKDVAFPKLNLASFHIYLFGSAFLICALLAGGLDTGWTFYTPYSSKPSAMGSGIILTLTAVFVLGFSSILTGLNFIVTIHKMRVPGLTWFKLPLFLWAIYATSVIQVLATPVLAITLLLLLVERTVGIGIFDPALGGDPVLFQHFFWFYSHPAVYIMILPAFGVISDLVAVHSRRPIFGYKFIAFSSLSIAGIGFLVWGHHMFTSGQSEWASVFFSFLTFAVAVPTAIKVFSWLATIYKGSIAWNTPMTYALSFIFLFTIGGLTGVFCAVLAVDVHIHDTYFVVAHFHYVMFGGTMIAFIGGLFHWWPKMFGKMYNEKAGLWSAFLVFVGFNLTFLTQFVLGTKGMPRRYHSYDTVLPELRDTFMTLHQISSIGSYILGIGLFVALATLIHGALKGKAASKNPWRAGTLEWITDSPPDAHNFHDDPIVTSGPYEYPSA